MPLKEYQSTTYDDLKALIEKINVGDAEIFIFFSCTLDRHGDPTTKACFESEDSLMEYTEFLRNSKRSLHLIYFRMRLEDYYTPNTEISADHYLRVNDVPTLLKWQGYQRLVGRQCGKIPLLSMLFEKECPNKFPVYKPCYYFGAERSSEAAGDGSKRSTKSSQGQIPEENVGSGSQQPPGKDVHGSQPQDPSVSEAKPEVPSPSTPAEVKPDEAAPEKAHTNAEV